MGLSLDFVYPAAWVAIPLDDVHEGAVMAAQSVLSRYPEPVERPLAAELETKFEALAELMIQSQATAGFALVPEPPQLGILGGLLLRVRDAAGDDAVADALADAAFPADQLIAPAELSTHETPLGEATLCIQRYAVDDAPLRGTRSPLTRKRTLTVVEHLCWYWLVDSSVGPKYLVTLTTVTEDLELTPAIRELTAAFAQGITRAD